MGPCLSAPRVGWRLDCSQKDTPQFRRLVCWQADGQQQYMCLWGVAELWLSSSPGYPKLSHSKVHSCRGAAAPRACPVACFGGWLAGSSYQVQASAQCDERCMCLSWCSALLRHCLTAAQVTSCWQCSTLAFILGSCALLHPRALTSAAPHVKHCSDADVNPLMLQSCGCSGMCEGMLSLRSVPSS